MREGRCSEVNLARDMRKVDLTVLMSMSPEVMITVLYAERHTFTTVVSSEFSYGTEYTAISGAQVISSIGRTVAEELAVSNC